MEAADRQQHDRARTNADCPSTNHRPPQCQHLGRRLLLLQLREAAKQKSRAGGPYGDKRGAGRCCLIGWMRVATRARMRSSASAW